ncbi:hypothetical protein Emag_003464 [Eimeria magna]
METARVSVSRHTEATTDEGPSSPSALEASLPTLIVGAPDTSKLVASPDFFARSESRPDAPAGPFPAETTDMLKEGDSSSCRASGGLENEASLPPCGVTEAAHSVGSVGPDATDEPEAEEALEACSAETVPAELDAAAQKLQKSADSPSARIPRLQGRQAWRPRGQRRSFGRLCRGRAAAGGCAGDGGPSSAAAGKRKWQQEQQQKQQQRKAGDLERQARAAKEAIRVQRRKQREAKRQRKKENELKSSKVQVIKDTTKIRKWNKQARRQLVKMSPEMIKQLYGVQL